MGIFDKITGMQSDGDDDIRKGPEPKGPVRMIDHFGRTVELDLGAQVLHVETSTEMDFMGGEEGESPVVPSATIAKLREENCDCKPIVSASMLAQKAKIFNDGLYAAVDIAAQEGAGSFGGKVKLLRSLISILIEAGQGGGSVNTLIAAANFGGLEVNVPEELKAGVDAAMSEFNSVDLKSKPIGHYTWSEELSKIFRQDRMLQEPLEDAGGVEAVSRALHGNDRLRETYEGYLELVSKLTNPLVEEKPSLRGFLNDLDNGDPLYINDDYYFFPPSRAHETEIIKRLYGDKPIPDDFSLIDEMIKLIRSGKQKTLYDADVSGWYDWMTWSLEPLIMPGMGIEAEKLKLGEEYKEQLEELFKGILALARETHIKQLEIPWVGAGPPDMEKEPPIPVSPELGVEPLYSHYLRTAISYSFIHGVVEHFFGEGAMGEMRRVTAGGRSEKSLEEELKEIGALYFGAAATCARELGIDETAHGRELTSLLGAGPGADFISGRTVGSGEGADADAAFFKKWAQEGDAAFDNDSRMMVPVYYDMRRSQTKVWLFFGWAGVPVEVSFAEPPKARVFEGDTEITGKVEIEPCPVKYSLAYPVTAEVYTDVILNREEFRKLCDEQKTVDKIIAGLTS